MKTVAIQVLILLFAGALGGCDRSSPAVTLPPTSKVEFIFDDDNERVTLSDVAGASFIEIVNRGPTGRNVQKSGAAYGYFHASGHVFEWYGIHVEGVTESGERLQWSDPRFDQMWKIYWHGPFTESQDLFRPLEQSVDQDTASTRTIN